MSVDADVHSRESNERRALQVVGICFLCLAAYIAYESATHADAKQTEFCTYLSAILLAGLLLNAIFGLSWADPVAGLIMVPIIAKEGVDGLQGKACQDCCAR